jgi:hypothetical protein
MSDTRREDKPGNDSSDDGGEKPALTLPAVVEKIIKPVVPGEPEKAQIAIQGADDLYREIRVENSLKNSAGEKVKLKSGAQVDVTIEASPDAIESKTSG